MEKKVGAEGSGLFRATLLLYVCCWEGFIIWHGIVQKLQVNHILDVWQATHVWAQAQRLIHEPRPV